MNDLDQASLVAGRRSAGIQGQGVFGLRCWALLPVFGLLAAMLSTSVPAYGQASVHDVQFDDRVNYRYGSITDRSLIRTNENGEGNGHRELPISSRGDFGIIDSDGLPTDSWDRTDTRNLTQFRLFGDTTRRREVQRNDAWIRFDPDIPAGEMVEVRLSPVGNAVDQVWWVVSDDHDRSNWVDPVNPGITPADDDFGTNRLLGDPASDDFPIGDASYVFDVNGPWVRADDSKIQGYTAEVTVGECGNAFVMGHRDPWVLSRGYVIEYRQTGGSWQIIGPEDLSAEDPTTLGCEAPSPPSVFQCPTTDLGASGAGYATSGDGQYKDSLLWLDWNCGTKNTFQPGDIIRKTWQYGPLEVTAELTDITAEIEPYDTGTFGGDRLSTFYGGVNPVGLVNKTVNQDFSYEIQWETRLNSSLVDNVIAAADAEATDTGGPTEGEGWRVTTDGDSWELIDVAENTGLLLEWSPDGQRLDAKPSGFQRGSFVVISDAVNKTGFTSTDPGFQAAAYAVPFGRDFGDLPDIYNNALPGNHLLRRLGVNGDQPNSPTTATSIDLADFILDPTAPYLGAIEPISRDEATPDASADAHEQDDGVQLPESLVPGSSVTIPVTVSGSGTLDAWIDWQGNGVFSGDNDQIATDVSDVNGNGVINLTVTVPDDAQPGETFARFRWSNQNDLSPNAIAADGEVEDYRITILEPTTRISGRVFNDNGLNGGTAHDGEVNGDEAGLGGVVVKALDNSNGNCQPGDVLAETTTNGAGEWSLSLSVDDEGKDACLVAETPNGFRAISESDGTADSDITLNALDDAEMTFTVPAPGTAWDGINFGKVGSPRLVPDNQGSVTPGNVIDYRHRFTAATAGEVAFSLANPTSTPDSPAWRQQVYPDPSCSGEADFSAPLTVNVEAEEQRCLLVRVFAPADAPTGAQHSVALTATQTLTLDDNSTVTDSVAVTDITRVQTGQLGLEKRVRNIGVDGEPDTTDDGDSDFQTRNQGEPCDVLRYEIRYTNTGTTPMADLEVNDATPAFTSLAAQAECPASVALPGNLTSCTLATPAGTNAVGYQGSVAWQFDGQLAPGAQGTVHYDVRIEGACH
ncbi:CshA/CshB family fibrillar adhesin-related protein [Vreelandella aquamarina]|uniref:CshA/CshB family fibrillar adhesin-related protein n=1 Tax=Vreelandella aquamarina TaxID=77097 RepID=UPI00384D8EC1